MGILSVFAITVCYCNKITCGKKLLKGVGNSLWVVVFSFISEEIAIFFPSS